MKRNITNAQIVDFDTGLPISDEISEWYSFQKDLYKINNPYVGNKRQIIIDIAQSIKREGIEYNTILDLFSGSSVVSVFMKLIGKRVISNDLLTSSYYNAVSFVENNDIVITEEELDHLCYNKNPNVGDFVQRNYPTRFLPDEAKFLDNYRANIESSFMEYPNITGDAKFSGNKFIDAHIEKMKIKKALEYVIMEYYVMSQCFLGGRLNNGQILAKVSHRIAHARNKGNSMQFKINNLPLFKSSKNHLAFNMDAEELLTKLDIPVDLVYIDPPYGKNQSDYASMFAFCEEYIYGASIDTLPHIKNSKKFVVQSEYEENFRKILQKCKNIPNLAISYNESSFSKIDSIKEIISEYRNNVKIINIDHEYRYRKDRSTAIEYLIIAR